jgi:aryl-alcohol dehydrogenase-like predicted oxidoreductase
MSALTEVVEAGKARYVGFSEWTVGQIQASLGLPGVVKWVSSQPQYSLLWRGPEHGVMEVCEANGISQIVWSPLAQGVLSGKYQPGEPPPPDSRAASEEMGGFIRGFFGDQVLKGVQLLRPIAEEAGLTMPQLALAWILQHQNVASTIICASRPEQVRENAAAAGVQLSADTCDAIDEALAGAVVG